MKQEYKILLIGLAAIGLLDTLGSMASRQFNFDYSSMSFGSFIIYGTVSFLVTKRKSLKTGALFAAILGLFDSTIGWKISMVLKANNGTLENEVTTGFWIATSILVTGLATLVGLIGAALARLVKRKTTNAQQRA